jgi:hypothetical protein
MDCNKFNFKKQLALAATLQSKIPSMTEDDAISYANRLWAMNSYSYPTDSGRIDELLRFVPKNITSGNMGDLLLIASDIYQTSHNKESFLEYRNKHNIDGAYNTLLDMHTENLAKGGPDSVTYFGAGGAFSTDFTDDFKDVGAIPTEQQQYNIKKRIAEELMPQFNKNHTTFIKGIVDWANAPTDNKYADRFSEDFYAKFFPGMKVSEKFLHYLGKTMNLSGYAKIYSVEGFLNDHAEAIGVTRSKILNGDFDTTNTLVVTHSKPGSREVVFSLFTLSPTSLSQAGMRLAGSTLFHNFLPLNNFTKLAQDVNTGKQYKDLNMPNNVGELERFKLSMLAAAIGKDMKNGHIMNVAVLKADNMNKNVKIHTRWTSMPLMIARMKTLSTIRTFMDSLSPGLQQMFSTLPNANVDNFRRSYMVEFYSLILEDKEYAGVNPKESDTGFITDEDVTMAEENAEGNENVEGMKALLDKVIDILRNKRGYTQDDLESDPLYASAVNLRRYYNDSYNRMQELNNEVQTSKFEEKTSTITKMKHPMLQQLANKLREIGTKIDIKYQAYRGVAKEKFQMLDKEWVSRNFGSPMYERLYSRPESRIENLKKMEWAYDYTSKEFKKVWLYRMHYTLDDPETRALFNEGKISEKELEFAKWAVDTIKASMIDVYKAMVRKSDVSMTEEEAQKYAEQRYIQNWTDGLLPLFAKTSSEFLRGGKPMKAIKRMWTNQTWNVEDGAMAVIGDTLMNETSAASLFYQQYIGASNSYYGGQFRMDKLGISEPTDNNDLLLQLQKLHPTESQYMNGKIIPVLHSTYSESGNTMLNNIDKFTGNIELLLDNFVQDSLFKQHMDTEGARTYQDFQAQILSDYARRTNKAEALLDVGEHLWMRLGQRIRPTDKDSAALQNISAVANMLYKLTSTAGVSLSVPVALTSFTANSIEMSLDMVARYFGNPKKLFTTKDYYKAAMWCARNFGHVEAIMDQYAMVNRGKEANMHDVRKKVTNKSWANEVVLHIMNFMTDYKARSEAIVSQMVHEGTLEAHKYVDGKSVYDWKLDKRWQGEDGALLLEAHKRRLRNDGLPNSFDEEGNPLYAYSLSDIQKLKLLGDEIVGAYEADNKPLAMDYLWVYVASQFRNFMWTKLPQRFYWGDKHLDIWSYDEVQIDDETGQKHVVRITPVEHGTFYGLVHDVLGPRLKLVQKTHSMSGSGKLNEQERYDVARASLDVFIWGFISAVLMAAKIAGGDKDKKEKTKVSGIFGLGFAQSLLKGFNSWTLLNPAAVIDMYMEIPLLGTAKRLVRTITGQATWGEVRRLTPSGGTIKMWEDLDSLVNNDEENNK